jgi:hypothetical protein
LLGLLIYSNVLFIGHRSIFIIAVLTLLLDHFHLELQATLASAGLFQVEILLGLSIKDEFQLHHMHFGYYKLWVLLKSSVLAETFIPGGGGSPGPSDIGWRKMPDNCWVGIPPGLP